MRYKNDKTSQKQKINELQEQINNLNTSVDNLQEKYNTNSNLQNSTSNQLTNSNNTSTSNSSISNDTISYEISAKENSQGDETIAIIKATKNGKTISGEFEMEAEIIDILLRGKVVLVAETGGEYYAFKVFRLSQDYTNGEIKDIVEVGTIQYKF